MEAVYEPTDAGYTRVHYTSDLETMTVFGISQWFSSLPRSGWYMWALTVVDNGTSQALELFVNGVSRGTGTTTQPEWAAGAGDYLLGMRGEGGREATASTP